MRENETLRHLLPVFLIFHSCGRQLHVSELGSVIQ